MGLDAVLWIAKELDELPDTLSFEDMYFYEGKFSPGQPRYRAEELHYWRKHHDLNRFMEQLYYAKGGIARDFNNVAVKVEEIDLAILAKNVLTGYVHHHDPLSFNDLIEKYGDYDCIPPSEFAKGYMDVIMRALDALWEGKTLYYEPSA